jgi:pimeloyl-ACP methyl ester carboxylesterase
MSVPLGAVWGELAMSGEQGVPRVVLVHGAFGGAWCWDDTSEALSALGVESVSIDLPTIGEGIDPSLDFHADAEYVREILDGLDGPVVLCGNPYGGVVITEASGGAQNVVRLIYLAAFMLDEQDEVPAVLLTSCTPEFLGGFGFGESGLATFDPDTAKDVVFDQAPTEVAQAAVDRFRPMALGLGSVTAVTAAGWRNIPSTYVVCSNDRSLQPDVQRRWAAQRATEMIEVPYDHCPQVSRPVEIAELLANVVVAMS